MSRRKYAVIVAGGQGLRMGADRPKQFLEVEGRPILRHTIERFQALGGDVRFIIVLPSSSREWWKTYCRETGFLESYTMVAGGLTRFHSVRNALAHVPDGAAVAVHDGVRPLVSAEFLARMFDEAENSPASVPVMPMVESMRLLKENGGSEQADRSRFVTVQTPQVFRSEVLKAAYGQAYSPAFTDDASVVEAAGYDVKLVPGERLNIKITTPEDLELFRLLAVR